VDLVTSTFYQKREQAGTAESMKQGKGISQEHHFSRTFSVVKELMVLNYREAVSFIWLKSSIRAGNSTLARKNSAEDLTGAF